MQLWWQDIQIRRTGQAFLSSSKIFSDSHIYPSLTILSCSSSHDSYASIRDHARSSLVGHRLWRTQNEQHTTLMDATESGDHQLRKMGRFGPFGRTSTEIKALYLLWPIAWSFFKRTMQLWGENKELRMSKIKLSVQFGHQMWITLILQFGNSGFIWAQNWIWACPHATQAELGIGKYFFYWLG